MNRWSVSVVAAVVALSVSGGDPAFPDDETAYSSRLRDQAQTLAVQMAREKTKQDAAKEREAQRQLRLARDRQLKYLYTKGLALYRQGSYQEAIEIFQQMAMVDPGHDLVKAGQRLAAQAEAKLVGKRAQAIANLPSDMQNAAVSQLEQLLAEKRMELETVIKYAKAAMEQRNYDMAVDLLQRAVAQNPNDRQAALLLDQAQLAKLKDEQTGLTRQVGLDEQRMANRVLQAELLNPSRLSSKPAAFSQTMTNIDASQQAQVLAKLQEPVSFDFKDVAFNDVLDFLGDSANISVIPSPRLNLGNKRVTLRVENAPLEAALKALVKSQGLAYRIDDMAILIASDEEFSNEPLETRVFMLHSGLGPFALETTAVEPNPALKMDSLKALIEQAVPQPSGSKLVVDERSGSLIVTNSKENLRLTEQLIGNLDIAPLQVLIEARFVEVSLSELQQLGLESVLTGNAALTKKGAGDGTRGSGHELAKSGGLKFPALEREDEGLSFTLEGVLTGTQFESVLHALEETQKTKTLSAPRITALNNQTATIKVVEEFHYPTKYEVSLVQFDVNGDGDFDDAGETEFVNVPKDFQKRDIGILLHVTPSVGKDMRTITLVLAPEVSNFSEFRDLGGGVKVPQFTSSQLTTSVTIQNGQTIVLGGLMKDASSDQLDKIPLLGDLPVLGGLFRQRGKTQTLKNLLIFVTGRILAPRSPTTI